MWAARYWAPRHWASRYFAPVGLDALPGYYWGRYWTGGYWAQRYWAKQPDAVPWEGEVTQGLSVSGTLGFSSVTVSTGSQFTGTVTQGLQLSGTLSIDGEPSYGDPFVAGAPLELAMSGTIGFSGVEMELGFDVGAGIGFYWPGRYWAANYWAPRYWQTQAEFNAEVTQGLAVSGEMTFSAVPFVAIEFDVGEIAISGALTIEATADAAEETPVTTSPGRSQVGRRRRNYIIRGKRYYDLTDEELAALVAEELISRAEVKVATRNKPHPISKKAWAEIKPNDDEEVIELLML